MKKVFVLVSDSNYLEHCKSLFYSVRDTGKWKDDLLLIAKNVDDNLLTDFTKFGVNVIKFNDDNSNGYFGKLYLFHNNIKKWDYVMYMDCDFTISDNVNDIVPEELQNNEILYAVKEEWPIHEYLCQSWAEDNKRTSLEFLYEKYDLDVTGFNSGFLAFNTKLINENTFDEIIELKNLIRHVNNHVTSEGGDQPIFNLYFQNKIDFIEGKKVCYWTNLDDTTIAQHHCTYQRPWENHDFNSKINKSYYQNYSDNLKNFYDSLN